MATVPQNPHERYFLGVRTAARHDWEQYFLEPQATRSSKPDSVEKEKAEKRAKQAATASVAPVSGTLVSAVLLDSQGRNVFETMQPSGAQPGYASIQLLGALQHLITPSPIVNNPPAVDVQVRLFGLFIRDRLKLVALDALHYTRLVRDSAGNAPVVNIPVGLWYHRPFEPSPWLDPYEALVSSDMRGDVDFAGICDFLGIGFPSAVELQSPHVQAEIARQLAIVGQLFPTN